MPASLIVTLILGIIALAGIIITTVQALLTRRFRRMAHVRSGRTKPRFVSILKPVCGLDDELEENLASFVALTGVQYEVIISAESADDPAIAVARRVMDAHPWAPFRIVIDPGSRTGVVNRKVERLIAAARVAKGEIFFISDSNVRVASDDIARTVAMFDDPRVGCVSNLFTGRGARTFGATIESLHLLGFVVPGAVIAATAGVPCVVGKSMAISREAHDAIGGFASFRRVLAEDQAIGLAVRKAGYLIALSPLVVRNVVITRTLARAVDRQVRWNKIRYAFSRPLYISEIVLNPLIFAAIAAVFAPAHFAAFPVGILIARCLQMALLDRATRAGLSWKQIAATPILDAVMFYAWLVPFVSNSVTWRGYEARIGRGTELVSR